MPKKLTPTKLPKSTLVITHFFTTGPAVELRDFLVANNAHISYIAHPFPFTPEDKRSVFEEYKKGLLQTKAYFPFVPRNEIILYLKDILVSWYFVMRHGKTYTLCIAADNLNTLAALLLKRLGKIKKVIYYNIDYTPQRFSNQLLNRVYHAIDRFCAYHADANWIGTIRTNEARQKMGIDMKKMAATYIVPDGNHAFSIKKQPISEDRRYTMVFVGHVLKKQGLDIVIDALPALKKKFPKIFLVVIGQGEYTASLQQKARRLQVESSITWKGYIQSHKEIEEVIASSGIALAPYVPDKSSVTNYSEAGKPKLYLGCGVPVILTRVPAVSKDIEKEKAGIVIDYTKESFIDAVVLLLSKKDIYQAYKKHATALGNKFDWSTIFTKTFNKMEKKL